MNDFVLQREDRMRFSNTIHEAIGVNGTFRNILH